MSLYNQIQILLSVLIEQISYCTMQVNREFTVRVLNHAIGKIDHKFRILFGYPIWILKLLSGERNRVVIFTVENRIIGKSRGLSSPSGTKCGSVCEQLFAPYVAIQEVGDRPPLSILSIASPAVLSSHLFFFR